MVFHAHNASGEVAAVKIISIPNEQQIREGEIAYGGDPELMESFFEQIANKFVAETESLKKLRLRTLFDWITPCRRLGWPDRPQSGP